MKEILIFAIGLLIGMLLMLAVPRYQTQSLITFPVNGNFTRMADALERHEIILEKIANNLVRENKTQ